jgi:hypothetical protein
LQQDFVAILSLSRLLKDISCIPSIHVVALVRSRMSPNAGRDSATRLITGGGSAFSECLRYFAI